MAKNKPRMTKMGVRFFISFDDFKFPNWHALFLQMHVETRIVELEWPPEMRLGESDIVRIALIPSYEGYSVTIELEGNKTITKPVQVARVENYDLFAIGQLASPNHMRKFPALFYEFEETGLNATLGYTNPGDLRDNYPTFFWKVVTPYIQDALRYLRVTETGKQWIANLYAHVFAMEHHEPWRP